MDIQAIRAAICYGEILCCKRVLANECTAGDWIEAQLDRQGHDAGHHAIGLVRAQCRKAVLEHVEIASVEKPALAQKLQAFGVRRFRHENHIEGDLFALRAQADDRLLGFAQFDWISWAHGSASLTLALGDPQAKAEGWLRPALEILAAYAFTELNLHSLNLRIPEYERQTQALLAECGFTLEVRQRQAVQRDGQRWDVLRYGLLQEEWQQRQPERSQP